MRIQDDHPHLSSVTRGPICHITINNHRYQAFIGETIATVLMAHDQFPASVTSAEQPGLSGFFCGIGLCYGCQMMVDGQLRRACITKVLPDMVIATTGEPTA